MLTSHIQKIKMLFVLFVVLIVIFIASGSILLKNNAYLTQDYLFNQLSFFKYKLDFLSDHNSSIAANAYYALNEPTTYEAPGAGAESIPVLVYHGIIKDKKTNSNDESDVTIDTFKEQMFALKRAGFETITTEELYAYLRGEKILPDKSFVLTFDDGRSDSIKNGDPILKVLDYEAVIFIITHYSVDESGGYYANKEKLKQISKSGRWDVQSHTDNSHISWAENPEETSHVLANRIFITELHRLETQDEYADRVEKDLKGSQSKLENLLGKKINSFAFPFGDYAQGSTNTENKNGRNDLLTIVSNTYNLGFYQHGPIIRFKENYYLPSKEKDGFFMVKRMHPGHDWSGEKLLKELRKTQTKNLPYIDTFTEDQGWISSWGKIIIDSNSLTVQAQANQAGGAAILDGTRLWKDYSIKARVLTPEQNNVYIWARFQDDNNNAGCNFGPGFTHIEHTVNGVKSVLKGRRGSDIILPRGEFTVEIRVEGRHMSCLLNGEEIVTTEFLNPVLSEGGIGFKTWDAVTTKGSLTVKELLVTPLEQY